MNIDIHKSPSGKKPFHEMRRMFCIKDGKVVLGPEDSLLSHYEWFKSEGWFSDASGDVFMNTTIRGCYVPAKDSLYSYRGAMAFSFDDTLIAEVMKCLPELREQLDLNDETKVCFGPVESIVMNKEYPQKCIGNVG